MLSLIAKFNQLAYLFPFEVRMDFGVFYDCNQGPHIVVDEKLKNLEDTSAVIVIAESQASEQPCVPPDVVVESGQITKFMPIGRIKLRNDGTLYGKHERTSPR